MGLLFYEAPVYGAQDTTPPTGKIVEPEQGDIISSNIIRIRASVADSGTGIKSVQFFARYYEVITFEINATQFKLLEEKTEPPWETYWDVSKIPDQDRSRMQFKINVEDSAGNIAVNAGEIVSLVILDRNETHSQKTIETPWVSKAPTIDGFLKDWPDSGTHFSNGDNRVLFFTAWDQDHLLVKEIARILEGLTPFLPTSQAILLIITRVFPDPAPAKTKMGPFPAVAAFRWAGVSFSKDNFKKSVLLPQKKG